MIDFKQIFQGADHAAAAAFVFKLSQLLRQGLPLSTMDPLPQVSDIRMDASTQAQVAKMLREFKSRVEEVYETGLDRIDAENRAKILTEVTESFLRVSTDVTPASPQPVLEAPAQSSSSLDALMAQMGIVSPKPVETAPTVEASLSAPQIVPPVIPAPIVAPQAAPVPPADSPVVQQSPRIEVPKPVSDFSSYAVKIKVIGVGGGGCNAVTHMIKHQIQGVDFIAASTDFQEMEATQAPTRIQIGPKLTRGLGVGGDYHMGRKAAEESSDALAAAIADTDLLFITAGMGGGTGTGSASFVAELARANKTLTIGIVTRPFSFEGSVRGRKAEEGISDLVDKIDTLIVIPNDRLLEICDSRLSVDESFQMADDVLRKGVQSISELLTVPGLINLDFADVRAIMADGGQSWMSMGKGRGANRAVEAAKAAITSPMLDVSIEGAKGVLLNVTGDSSLSISEVTQAAEIIRSSVDPEANIIFGVANDPAMGDDVNITIVATGFHRAGSYTLKPTEEEIRQRLKELKASDQLDTPAFMRKF